MRRAAAVLALAVAIAVGCASGEGKAEDKPAKPGDEGKVPEKPGAKPAEEKKPEKRWNAKVDDRYGTPTVTINDANLFAPESSIFGGAGGETQKEIVVKRGAFEIRVPFDEIATIEVGKEVDDRLEIAIRFRDPEKKGSELRGTVRSNLELHGVYEGTNLKAESKLRELKRVVLEEAPERPAPATKPAPGK